MDNSPFGKLPPELRNRIYTLAMSEEKTINFAPQIRKTKAKRAVLKPISAAHRPPQGFSLIATCRQMRKESSMLFYACNDFAFIRGIGALKTFVRMIGKRNARALRSVTIKVLAGVHVSIDSSKSTMLPDQRNSVHAYAKLARQYRWTSALGEVKFEMLDGASISEVFYATLNFADLREPWDEFISKMEENSITSPTFKTRSFFLGVKNEVQAWRDSIKAC